MTQASSLSIFEFVGERPMLPLLAARIAREGFRRSGVRVINSAATCRAFVRVESSESVRCNRFILRLLAVMASRNLGEG
jgi:hypothetical protein